MYSKMTRALIALIALTFMVSVAHADRRTSLGGNQLIPDRDDVFVYPQLALKKNYRNSLSIDFGASGQVGNALIISKIDKVSVLAFALNRSDTMLSIGGGFYNGSPEAGMINNNIIPGVLPSGTLNPLNIADIIYSRKLGKNKLGVRLSFVGAGQSNTNKGDHVNGQDALGYRLSLGYTLGKKGDFVFDFAMINSKTTQGKDEEIPEDGSFMNVHLGGRYTIKKQKGFRLVSLFDFNMGSVGTTVYPDAGKDVVATNDLMAVQLGLGPVYSGKVNEKKYTVAFHGHFGFNSSSSDPNTSSSSKDDQEANSGIMFPGFNAAMEYQLLSWLVFRSGANYSYVIHSSTTTTSNSEKDEAVASTHGAGQFGWNAGFGFLMDNFTIDGTLSNGFMTNGPAFISGANSGLFTLVSATGKF